MREIIVNAELKLRLNVPEDMTLPEQQTEIENLIAEGEYFPWQVESVSASIEPRPA